MRNDNSSLWTAHNIDNNKDDNDEQVDADEC